MNHAPKCAICGAANAPHGFGYAGQRKDRKSLAILSVCDATGCIDAAVIRWEAANRPIDRNADPSPRDAAEQPQTGSRGGVRGEASVSAQGVLI